jgi:endonuclease-3 related protein
MLLRFYHRLLKALGPQGWWPVKHGLEPPGWEIMAGAVLTQNTAWANVDKALGNLSNAGISDRKSLLKLSEKKLAELIRPSGYFNQKAKKLKVLAGFEGPLTRENLLGLWGIGRETADSILLYAFNRPYFVVDAYTRRIFSRLGLIEPEAGYEQAREFFESRLPRDPEIYKEFHALLVKMAKRFCMPKPSCKGCPIEKFCEYETR